MDELPSTYADRIAAGEKPIRVLREWRGMTIVQLAERVGVAPSALQRIESGNRSGPIETYRKIAEALEVKIDNLI